MIYFLSQPACLQTKRRLNWRTAKQMNKFHFCVTRSMCTKVDPALFKTENIKGRQRLYLITGNVYKGNLSTGKGQLNIENTELHVREEIKVYIKAQIQGVLWNISCWKHSSPLSQKGKNIFALGPLFSQIGGSMCYSYKNNTRLLKQGDVTKQFNLNKLPFFTPDKYTNYGPKKFLISLLHTSPDIFIGTFFFLP